MTRHENIRRSRPEDVPRLSELFHEAFGHRRPDDIWFWKYFGQRDSVGYVCESDGRIVAHCGGVPVRFRDGSHEHLALQSVDFMSSPTHSGGLGGGGVFVRTVRRMFEECCGPTTAQVVYGFPGERHRLVGEKLLGYRAIEPVHELKLVPAKDSEKPEPLVAGSLPLFAHEHAFVGAIRDEDYLRWRYLQHPTHRYATIQSGGVRPFQRRVSALLREIGDHFMLMEVAGLQNQRDARRLAEVLKRLGKPVTAWGSPQNAFGLFLVNAGFMASRRDHWIETRFFIDRQPPSPGEMYYTAGDYDVF